MRSIVVLVVVLAGCATQTPSLPDAVGEAPLPPEAAGLAPLDISFEWCFSVGALSVYPLDDYARTIPMPDGISLLDIRGLVGDPAVVSANGAGWFTALGPITGHWHVSVDCTEHDWGFVAIAIEPPGFDHDPAALNFLLAAWSWMPPALDVVASHGHATEATEVGVVLNAGLATMVLDDREHGRYEGAFIESPAASRAAVDGTVRFWMLLPEEGHHNHAGQEGPFSPISYDLAGGLQVHHSGTDTTGVFAHTGTDHHEPLPGLGGNTLGVTLDIPDGARLVAGPRPDVHLNTTWIH